MNIQEQRRARFEKWILDNHCGDEDLVLRDNEGEYYSVGVAERWEMYNAALDSIEIELPPSITASDAYDATGMDDEDAASCAQMVNGAIASCGAFIRAAGLKVTP
ncbi:hypothetical protein LMK08_16745 [Metapseudomonas furukawaii]|uniref:hypothetical protein n=1 Tax=Metapseudomonas furukawaii TaxID=1149133 RepID=UPI00227BEFD8|nr:hypothetical protein [Pseudomonas furukawaii]WAG77024.1 hypothetical protein LMK08_16745 [Pseudomonas furukawaii]